jgi:putative acetyltransferase
MSPPTQLTHIVSLSTAPDPETFLRDITSLFMEYQAFLGIPLDFQNFQDELDNLPGKYAPPKGNLYLVLREQTPIGCGAFYPLCEDICEIKRLYLTAETRGHGIGKQLFERLLNDIQALGYAKVRLDSLKRLESATKLYGHYGFYPIPPYNENPHPDVYYLECDFALGQDASTDL